MIHKELDPPIGDGPFAKAGRAAEEQMAHYLRRAFADDEHIFVFNSLRYEQDGDAAQIDHAVLHPYGLVIIESKSVTGRIRVNEHREWTRVYGTTVKGMASPILQAERQSAFLRAYLSAHPDVLAGKELGINIGVAISDGGIIDRPRGMDLDEVRKADQIPGYIREVMLARRTFQAMPRTVGRVLAAAIRGKVSDTLTEEDLHRLSDFLLAHHRPLSERGAVAPPLTAPTPPLAMTDKSSYSAPVCRTCGSGVLTIEYGFSYYFKCRRCQGNTPIHQLCHTCGGPERLRKSHAQYFSECPRCKTSRLFHTNPVEA